MGKRHLVITGTGRAGTSFLVQLFTRLGQDTGFQEGADVHANCNAGLEWDILHPDTPYVVKSPFLCDQLPDVLRAGVEIEHAIVPVRELFAAAESRRDVLRRKPTQLPGDRVPGGLFGTTDPHHQEAALAEKFYRLMHALAEHDIPHTLLHFPRLVRDGDYLYAKLRPVLPGVDAPAFSAAFAATARPILVHDFKPRGQ